MIKPTPAVSELTFSFDSISVSFGLPMMQAVEKCFRSVITSNLR